LVCFFFQAEDGIRDFHVTAVQTCALPICTGEPMLIACLWSHWSDPQGGEPELYSFAAITDDPEPEVAAAGHDRTVINIRPEHVEIGRASCRERVRILVGAG